MNLSHSQPTTYLSRLMETGGWKRCKEAEWNWGLGVTLREAFEYHKKKKKYKDE